MESHYLEPDPDRGEGELVTLSTTGWESYLTSVIAELKDSERGPRWRERLSGDAGAWLRKKFAEHFPTEYTQFELGEQVASRLSRPITDAGFAALDPATRHAFLAELSTFAPNLSAAFLVWYPAISAAYDAYVYAVAWSAPVIARMRERSGCGNAMTDGDFPTGQAEQDTCFEGLWELQQGADTAPLVEFYLARDDTARVATGYRSWQLRTTRVNPFLVEGVPDALGGYLWSADAEARTSFSPDDYDRYPRRTPGAEFRDIAGTLRAVSPTMHTAYDNPSRPVDDYLSRSVDQPLRDGRFGDAAFRTLPSPQRLRYLEALEEFRRASPDNQHQVTMFLGANPAVRTSLEYLQRQRRDNQLQARRHNLPPDGRPRVRSQPDGSTRTRPGDRPLRLRPGQAPDFGNERPGLLHPLVYLVCDRAGLQPAIFSQGFVTADALELSVADTKRLVWAIVTEMRSDVRSNGLMHKLAWRGLLNSATAPLTELVFGYLCHKERSEVRAQLLALLHDHPEAYI